MQPIKRLIFLLISPYDWFRFSVMNALRFEGRARLQLKSWTWLSDGGHFG